MVDVVIIKVYQPNAVAMCRYMNSTTWWYTNIFNVIQQVYTIEYNETIMIHLARQR